MILIDVLHDYHVTECSVVDDVTSDPEQVVSSKESLRLHVVEDVFSGLEASQSVQA